MKRSLVLVLVPYTNLCARTVNSRSYVADVKENHLAKKCFQTVMGQ
jgi:hypothetical protein